MDTVRKPNISESDTPSSESYSKNIYSLNNNKIDENFNQRVLFLFKIYTPKHNHNIYNYTRFENIFIEAQVVTELH
jgi:hypothetical protein